MYVNAQDACNVRGGEAPLSPEAVAASRADSASADAAVINANQNWNNVVQRTWRSFADLGPNVAWQLRDANSSPGVDVVAGPGNAPPAATPSVGVDLVATGNPDGSVPSAGGAGGSSDRGRVRRRGLPGSAGNGVPGSAGTGGSVVLGGEDAAFLQRFGYPPVATFTGPRPEPGSVLSLVYGGAGRSTLVGPGVYAAATPQASAGYYRADCPDPVGVSMLPWGEPNYGASSGSAVGSAAGSRGLGGALLALLALAGLAYIADRDDKKKGRTKV